MSPLPDLFPGFEARTIPGAGAEIFARVGGSGPPLLLVHGYPQTHACWHKVAPALAERFTLVIPDLRGYGASQCLPPDPEHETYSKRAMTRDLVEVMSSLGHDRFGLVGHDRGARVSYRMALDHAERIERLAVLDIVPTGDIWAKYDAGDALGKFHWTFLAVPAPLPEKMIAADAALFLETLLARWAGSGDLSAFSEGALMHYRAFFSEPDRIAATCEDYRAGATLDRAHDDADKAAGRRIACPVLALWGSGRGIGTVDGPLEVWREWCDQVSGQALPCGHFLQEEMPERTLELLLPFLEGRPA